MPLWPHLSSFQLFKYKMAVKWLPMVMGMGCKEQIFLSDYFHTFSPTGPVYDPRPKWFLCEPF